MIDAKQLPTIAAGRVNLRWLTTADVPELFKIFSDPAVMRYWSSPPLRDLAAAEELLQQIHECFERKDLFEWGVARASDDQVIGTCTLNHIDQRHRRAEIGFALAQDAWGQGYMTEAVRSLLTFAFTELKLHRIEADVDPHNAASIRCLERFGFRKEGYLRERWWTHGEVQDALFYGLLRSEWK